MAPHASTHLMASPSKTRKALTVLAIVLGAFTLTITSAIGTGVSSYEDNQIGAFGAPDVFTVTKTADDAAPETEGPVLYDPDKAANGGDGGSQFETPHLTPDDLDAIRLVDDVTDVSAEQLGSLTSATRSPLASSKC